MSNGAFGYPLCFAAMFAAMGLFVSMPKGASTTSARERAAYEEIVTLYQDETHTGIREKCLRFMTLYPASKGFETIAIVFGESLVKSEKWEEVGAFYRGLESKFSQSSSLDRFVFFQALALFQDANFTESTPLFNRILTDFPSSPFTENAYYYMAMSNFLNNQNNQYNDALNDAGKYLQKFPDGYFAGDMRYRIAFIDFNDKDVDQSDKIIRDLSEFLAEHPDDPINGSMYCLLADTYKKKKTKTDLEATATEDKAIEAYIKGIWTDSSDDVIQYALDSATNMLWARKDWAAVGDLHAAFLKSKPDSQLAPLSAKWAAKMKSRQGNAAEAVEILACSLKAKFNNPANEQVEILIDELVNTHVPLKKREDIDLDTVDKQLVEVLNKAIGGVENPTTAARICYARARLAQILHRNDRWHFYLIPIATGNAKDPSALSPALLAVCGEVLLKSGDLDGAEAMFQRLNDHFPEAICVDAGLVGLGYVVLARNTPAAALGVFEQALKKPGNMRFNEATLGKLEALVDLDQLEPAEILATEIIGDKKFRGEFAAKAYFQLSRIYRKQAAKAEGEKASVLLKKAYKIYIRIYVAYQAYPDLSAEGIWQASEVAKELGFEEQRQMNLHELLDHPKLKNTEPYKKAANEVDIQ